MIKFVRASIFAATMFAAKTALAADAALQVDADLILHPTQIAKFLTLNQSKLNSTSQLAWSELEFQIPYKTAWTNVTASGQLNVALDSSKLATGDVGFELTWASPKITAGSFAIHDVVTKVISGVTINVHLDGSCTGLSLSVPNANWDVKGSLHWNYQTNQFEVSYNNFTFTGNSAATPALSLGQCNAPAGLVTLLAETFGENLKDQKWLGSLFQNAVLSYAQSELATVQTQLLSSRAVALNANLNGNWTPASLTALPGGLLRVAGTFALSKPGATAGATHVTRNYDPAILNAVAQSGLIAPSNTLQAVLNYMSANGELSYRMNSTSVGAITSLLSNSLEELFIWPDLMKFPSNTNFIFDITTSNAPRLGTGYVLKGGGSAYPLSASMLVHQSAPNPRTGVQTPYVDFTSPLNGTMSAKVANGKLNLSFNAPSLSLNASWRPEYAALRAENPYIATSLIAPEVQTFLNSQSYSIALPTLSLESGVNLQVSDVQVYQQSLRVPFNFAN